MPTPIILLTGSSRGLGLSIATHLLSHPSNPHLILTFRTTTPSSTTLTSLHPTRTTTILGDLSNPEFPKTLVKTAIEKHGYLSAVIINHGTLDPVGSVVELEVEAWRRCFEVNFFSAVAVVGEALPALRAGGGGEGGGKVVFVSSGAAVHGYEGWGAYGASKAALNHFCLTVAKEEARGVVAVAVRPGVVDTQMQQEIREKHGAAMRGSHEKFVKLKEEGKLLPPEVPAAVIANLALRAEKGLSGKFLSWDAEELRGYR